VGFGAISPASAAANVIAALEGSPALEFRGRDRAVVRPCFAPLRAHRISEVALIAPYQDGTSFQFRIVNRRTNTLLEPSVTVLLMTVDRSNGAARREFKPLKLETRHDHALPAHVDGCSSDRFREPTVRQDHGGSGSPASEFMVFAKAWDETFSQTVHQALFLSA